MLRQSFNVNKYIQTGLPIQCWLISYMFFVIFQWQKIFKVLHQKSRYNRDISYQMKKEVCFNINQHIWITLHRLVPGTSYLFNVGLTHWHSVLFSSHRDETKVLKLPFWLRIFGKISIQIKNWKLLKIEVSIWATLNSTVSYDMLVKDVQLILKWRLKWCFRPKSFFLKKSIKEIALKRER